MPISINLHYFVEVTQLVAFAFKIEFWVWYSSLAWHWVLDKALVKAGKSLWVLTKVIRFEGNDSCTLFLDDLGLFCLFKGVFDLFRQLFMVTHFCGKIK